MWGIEGNLSSLFRGVRGRTMAAMETAIARRNLQMNDAPLDRRHHGFCPVRGTEFGHDVF